MLQKNYSKSSLYISISVLVLIVFRFVLTGAIPLLDKTEARYSEIARIMYETKEWVVLQVDYGVPFWAKPPLSTWLSALSFEVFGVNEIAARFPSFILSIILVLVLGKMLKKTGISFYLPAFILLTTPEFLIHTGVVSTDTALGFCIALIMISFWKSMQRETYSFWNYLFFIALGLGFLSKGPIILILTVPPIFIWIFLQKITLKELYSKLPWIKGVFIVAIIAVPWYLLTEKKSPGFIDYFIIGEHFKRFLVPGWKGDLYGGPKSQPLGMIWVFLLLFAFPWVQIVLYRIWKDRKTIFKDKWVSFLVLWLLWTPFFFTFSKNILHTYILPVTVPIALLVAHWWENYQRKKLLLGISSIFPALVIVAFFGFFLTGSLDHYMNSDKYLLENQNIHTQEKETPVYYWKLKSYSGQFYSQGKAQIVNNKKELDSVSKIHDKLFLVMLNRQKKSIPKEYKTQIILLESNYKTSVFLLNQKTAFLDKTKNTLNLNSIDKPSR